MRFWTDGGFFSSVKGHVFKWWQLIIRPILRINNNNVANQQMVTNVQQVNQNVTQMQGANTNTDVSGSQPQNEPVKTQKTNVEAVASVEQEVVTKEDPKPAEKSGAVSNEDPMEILKRINDEKEAKRRKEIEVARKKAEERERINAIMNANKVDVNAFIAAGEAAKKEKAAEKEKRMQEENLRRAQEIMERLNREAAADEYKKQAEIEAAKQEAEKQFGK